MPGKTSKKLRRIIRTVLPFLIPFSIGTVMLLLSWRKWPDVIIDFGRELYIPWRISEGSVLYKDIAYFFGPLSAYANAFLFKVFGVNYIVLAVSNIALVGVLALVIYRIFLKTTDELAAGLATSLFLAVFAFSQYGSVGNFNFVCPYTYSVTHGIFLSFLVIYAFIVYLTKHDHKLLFLIGVLLGFVFLTKPEVFLAIAVAVGSGISLDIFLNKMTMRNCLKIWGAMFIGFFIPLACFIAYFSMHMPLAKAIDGVLFPYKSIFQSSVTSLAFYKHIMGVDFFKENIWWMLLVGNFYVLTVLVLVLANNLAVFEGAHKKWVVFGIAVCLGLIFVYHLAVIIARSWYQLFRPLPLTTLFLGGYFLMHLRNTNDAAKIRRFLPMLVLSIFAFLLLLKIIFRVLVSHYGFALAMPAALLLVAGIFYYLPVFLKKYNNSIYFFRILTLFLMGVVLFIHMDISRMIYYRKSYPFGTKEERMFGFKRQALTLNAATMQQAIKKIEEIVKKDENFVAYPEGVMLNYLTRRINPTGQVNFCPPELKIFGESEILGSFQASKPDYFVFIHRNMAEYGHPTPGQCWGQALRAWVEKNYSCVFTSAKGSLTTLKGSGFTILKRIK